MRSSNPVSLVEDGCVDAMAEKLLQESVEKYHSLIANIPDVMWTTDCKGNTVFISPNVERVYGYSPEEIYKGAERLWFGRVHPDDIEKVKKVFKALFGKGRQFDIDYRIKRKDGQWIWLHNRSIVTYEKDGVMYADGLFADITDLKNREEELKESEQRFRAIFDNANDGILLAETETRKFYFGNKTIYQMLGYNEEEIKGLGVMDIHPQEVLPYVIEQFEKQSRREIALTKDIPTKRKDGSVFYADINSSPITLAGRKYIIGVFRDVTERKQMEEKLRETNQYLENLFNCANAPIIVWDPQFKIIRFNHAFEALTGRRAHDVIGKSIKILFPTDKVENSMEFIRETLEGKRWETIEINILHLDGAVRAVLWNSATLFDLDGKTPVATIAQGQDITERKKAEEKQAQLLKELENTNRELRDFMYIASHDLKSPLRGIRTLAQWLSADYAGKLGEQGKEQMDLLLRRAERMHNMIEGILQYSRLGRVKENRAVVNLNKLVHEVIDRIAPPENITITIENELPAIECEPTRIAQVFQNLLSNAVKYVNKPRGLIKIGCVEEDEFWKFGVGKGILKRFSRFFRHYCRATILRAPASALQSQRKLWSYTAVKSG
jgi:two-component system sensor kinase FixL